MAKSIAMQDKAMQSTWSWLRVLLVSARASLALGSAGGPAMGAGAGAAPPCMHVSLRPTPGKLYAHFAARNY